jgi:sodium/potassium-transporting ATPase subunit alpha
LIKFLQPIFDIEEYRKQYPTFSYEQDGKTVEALIPFSSEIKFNMFIRDMNHKETNPKSKSDNMVVYLKGAPDRIFSRCNKILLKGEERDFDEAAYAEVKAANDSLGKLGERVLAFAKCELDP